MQDLSEKVLLLEDENNDQCDLEKFYVYKELKNDNCWGAVIANKSSKIPNCSFLFKTYAKNEKEAVGNVRKIYDTLYKNQNTENNIRKFVSSVIKDMLANKEFPVANEFVDLLVVEKVKLSIKTYNIMDKELNKYFSNQYKE